MIRSRRAVLPGGERPASVSVRGGRITAITPYEQAPPAASLDLGEVALLPGLVDTHVHVNEPGRTEWEGFATATRAAASGGVTTLIDMPLNSLPPTVDPAALAAKRTAAEGACAVARLPRAPGAPVHPRPVELVPGRRHRAAPRPRRRRPRPPPPGRPDRRPGGPGERRPRRRVLGHVLLLARQHAAPRARPQPGRGLGDGAPPRRRPSPHAGTHWAAADRRPPRAPGGRARPGGGLRGLRSGPPPGGRRTPRP